MGATVRTFQRSFAGGEITPEMFGRIDDVRYQTGLSKCLNFISLPHGPVVNRAGFEFVREVKDSTKKVRLLPFTFSSTQTVVIEMGEGYFRFHSEGGTVLSAGVPYEVANSYDEDDLFQIKFVQSADVLTLAHPDYPVSELRRLGATSWTFVQPTFGAGIAAPTGLAVTPTTAGASFLRTYSYVVTARLGQAESLPSSAATASNNLNAASTYNDLSWNAVVGADGYNIYRLEGGVYYLVGATTGNGSVTLRDDALPYNGGITPPVASDPFASSNYPGALTYYEQRKGFAGTTTQPQNVWLTKSGTETNFNYSIPPRSADSVQFAVAARDYNRILHMVPLQDLILLTSAGEWRVFSVAADALAPDTLAIKPQSFVGANHATPITVNSNLIFVAARGGHVREMAYAEQAGGYLTGDLSLRAPHLFDGKDIVDTAFTKAPYPILWFVNDEGVLLGLTYIPEQAVVAWHQHLTGATYDTETGELLTQHYFESIAAVAEPDQDALYAVVRREINGSSVRYIERLRSRAFDELEDAFFVDAGATYDGSPITTVTSGLDHLEGETVSILADGAVLPQQVVTGGEITLEEAASKITVGLPITADVQTLPFAVEMQGMGQGRAKNVNEVFLRLYRSSGLFAGPSFGSLRELKQRTTEPYGSPPRLVTDEVSLRVDPSWSKDGALCIRQSDPLPLTIVSMSLETVVAG